MNQAQEVLLRVLGIATMAAGVLCVVKGGFSVHSHNNGQDEMNLRAWKSIASWWALGGIILASGSYMVFQRFVNNVFHYVMGS
jgi:hypothetical protein